MSNKKKVKVKFNFDTYIAELDKSDKGLEADGKTRKEMPQIFDFNSVVRMNQIVELDEDIAERYLNEELTLPIGSRSEPVLPVLSKNAYLKSNDGVYINDDMVSVKFKGKEVSVSKGDFMKTIGIYEMNEKSYAISHGFMHKYFQIYSSGTLIQRNGLTNFITSKVLMRAEMVS